jgi:hypothetical protein
MCRLQTHVVVTRPTRIKTWYDSFERVATTGVGELVPSTAETFQIVLTLGICVPEVELELR